MGAKAILKRYLVRTREHSPVDSLKLREHLASVAERSGLKVTEGELSELVPLPLPNPPLEGREQGLPVEKPREAKKKRSKAATKKTGA